MVIGVVGHEPTFTCAWVRLIVVKPLGPDMVQEGFEAGGLLTTQEKVTGVEVFLRTRLAVMEKVAMSDRMLSTSASLNQGVASNSRLNVLSAVWQRP